MYIFIIVSLFILLVIQFIKYVNIRDELLHALIDLEEAYDALNIDQFDDKGVTDIGGLQAQYMTSNKKDRAKLLDDYVNKIQRNRKQLGKPPIKYSEVSKTWKLDNIE